MRRQMEWHHLRLTAGSHAGSVTLSDAEDGRPLGTLTVDFPTPWVPGPATLDDDEFEWQWTRDDQPADDATAPAHLSSTRPSSTDLSSSRQPSTRQPDSTRATVRISTQPGFCGRRRGRPDVGWAAARRSWSSTTDRAMASSRRHT